MKRATVRLGLTALVAVSCRLRFCDAGELGLAAILLPLRVDIGIAREVGSIRTSWMRG
jgi:hypothetical protein